MTNGISEILADLAAEYDRLEAMLEPLGAADWARPSAAAGWTLAHVVTHLALTEEAVVRSLRTAEGGRSTLGGGAGDPGPDLEATMAAEVTAAALDGKGAFARWQAARRASLAALAEADPNQAVPWAGPPLKPRTLATTRLAEHWAHGLDLAGGLGVDLPDTERLRHVAWLGHATLPYAFRLASLEPVPVRAELTGPAGGAWTFGPDDAPTRIAGPASDFCRVGAQRLQPGDSRLVASGPHGGDVLRLLRNWAA